MRRNRLRERLRAGEASLGTHLLSVWPTLVELIGQAGGYDYVEFSGEYAPFTMHDLDNLGRALEVADLSGMLKVEQTQWTHQAMRATGSGIQNVLFADIRSVADAEACVRAVRAETPRSRGLLGVGMRRDVGTIRDVGNTAYVQSLEDAVVAIMVEKRECVEDLDAILSVPGIDMVQFGPADYAMSIGRPGEWTYSEVAAAEQKTIETALAKGIAPRVELADPAQGARYIEMGVKHFCIGWDVSILHAWWRENGAAMRAMLEGTKPAEAKTDAAAKAAPKGNYG
jgi:2-keto-3-deoxy-L-rhamnonate aldolase RhmA